MSVLTYDPQPGSFEDLLKPLLIPSFGVLITLQQTVYTCTLVCSLIHQAFEKAQTEDHPLIQKQCLPTHHYNHGRDSDWPDTSHLSVPRSQILQMLQLALRHYVLRRLAPPGLDGLPVLSVFSVARFRFRFSPAASLEPPPDSTELPFSLSRSLSFSFSRPLLERSVIFTEELLPGRTKTCRQMEKERPV